MKKYALAMLLVVPSFSCAMDGENPIVFAIKMDDPEYQDVLDQAIHSSISVDDDETITIVLNFRTRQSFKRYTLLKKLGHPGNITCKTYDLNTDLEMQVDVVDQDPVVAFLNKKSAECEDKQQKFKTKLAEYELKHAEKMVVEQKK